MLFIQAGKAQVVFQIEVEPPPPPPVPKPVPQFRDAKWVKVYKTELQREMGLDELVDDNPVVPQDAALLRRVAHLSRRNHGYGRLRHLYLGPPNRINWPGLLDPPTSSKKRQSAAWSSRPGRRRFEWRTTALEFPMPFAKISFSRSSATGKKRVSDWG
jgi:hypothetical protein